MQSKRVMETFPIWLGTRGLHRLPSRQGTGETPTSLVGIA